MSVELPCQLGPYLLLRHLASGGMGAVYLAYQEREGAARLCVVKTVRGDYAGDRVATRRFVDEARTSALLRHPNVVEVYDVGEAEGTAYIAVEYVAGRDLAALFLAARQAGGALPVALALHLGAELFDALAYVHQAADPRTGEPLRVVHRDVSPQNVLVGFDGAVKLIDFGIARCAVREELTRVGQLVGKLRYVSPEQARGEPVDGATDVWAACVTTCELLTGNRFWGERRAEAVAPLLAAGERVEPPGFAELDPDVKDALLRGLDPEARRRRSAAELGALLRALADKRGLVEARAQTRAIMQQLFSGEEEREQRARAALLVEPTVVRAAAMPESAVYLETDGDLVEAADEASHTDRLTIGMRPLARPDTRVLEATPQSVPVPAAPPGASSSRRARPRPVPRAALVAALAGALGVVVLAGLAFATREPAPASAPPAALDAPSAVSSAAAPGATPPTGEPPSAAPALPAAPGAAAVAASALTPSPPAGALPSLDPAAAARPRKPAHAKRGEARPRLFGDRVRALKECSPRPACASAVLRQADDVTSLSVEELRALDAALERCLQRCR